jgi:hypothetical protein
LPWLGKSRICLDQNERQREMDIGWHWVLISY